MTARVPEALGGPAAEDESAVLASADRFCAALGVEMRLEVPEADLDAMAGEAHAIRGHLDDNPRALSREAIATPDRAA